MATLVTGGCGLVGSFIMRHLVGMDVPAVAYDISLKTELLTDLLPKIKLVKGDVTVFPELMRTVLQHNVDRIIHTASFLTPGALERPYAAVPMNIISTLNVFEVARLSGVKRVVFTSTGKTPFVGERYAKSCRSGKLDLGPDPYVSSKLANELLCNDYRKLYGLDVIIARFNAHIYGPGYSFAGGIGQLLQNSIDAIVRGQPGRIEKENRRDPIQTLIYARDAAKGATLCSQVEKLEDWVFDIVGPERRSLPEMAKVLCELVPGAQIEVTPTEERGGPTPPNSRAAEQLGYLPEYDMRRGFKEYIDFLKTGKLPEML
ncbi:MAG: NAD(P)-dependent oxidoreductase [Deltaproteobacteria bacterium]|nr:NAD(P)-dependent oxidoreductase [Deltaproteobacteria bacterium]